MTVDKTPRMRSTPMVALTTDRVHRATKDLPERQREAIRWYFAYMRLEGITNEQAASKLDLHASNLNRLLNGKYEGDVAKYVSLIESIRARVEAEAKLKSEEFVETSISRKIFQVCEFAWTTNSIASIYGDSQIGKTFALREFARRRNHGLTRYFRFPGGGGGVQLMMKELSRACGNSTNGPFETLRGNVLDAIGAETLLIADEVHEAFMCYQKTARVTCMEVLREIHDRTSCGLVLCGTNILRDEMETGKFRKMLQQIKRRGVIDLQLPSKLPKRDVVKLAAAYGLPAPSGEAEDLVDGIVADHGAGKFTKFMKAARRLAKNKNQKLGWQHFVTAHDILANLSEQKEED